MNPADWQSWSREQLLVAYADGKLDAAARRQVELWLGQSSEATEHLRAARDLSPANAELWQSLQPRQPSNEAWTCVWDRIEAHIHARKPVAAGPARKWWRGSMLAVALACVSAAAAAIVLAAALHQPRGEEFGSPLPSPESVDEAMIVAQAIDVEIHSVREADVQLLVVGDPPLPQTLLLAGSGDVRLNNLRPDRDGMLPEAHMGGSSNMPMIFPPMARNP